MRAATIQEARRAMLEAGEFELAQRTCMFPRWPDRRPAAESPRPQIGRGNLQLRAGPLTFPATVVQREFRPGGTVSYFVPARLAARRAVVHIVASIRPAASTSTSAIPTVADRG